MTKLPALIGLALLAACGSKMTPESTDMASGGADMAQAETTIVGTWESSGDDIAKLLSAPPLEYVKIVAVFKDASYEVTATGKDMNKTLFTGVYTTQRSKVEGVWDITLTQDKPTAATSKGIFQIDVQKSPQRMTYEVAQITAPVNAMPPTAESGFGSTNMGMLGDKNIQKYNRTAQ